MPFMRSWSVALLLILAGQGAFAETALVVKSPMSPPAWALLERELVKFDSLACERFAAKCVDERGYLLHTPRWAVRIRCSRHTRKRRKAIGSSTARCVRTSPSWPKKARVTKSSSRSPTGSTPAKALSADLERVRKTLAEIREDATTPRTRLADYLLGMNPAETDALTNLTLGGYFGGRIWTLHSRFRYFDPARRRAGLPEDVAALVEKLGADSATLTLVNVNPVDARTVIVQAGGYAEHRFDTAQTGGETVAINAPHVEVKLEPGCGARIEFKMTRYQNRPTLAQPWGR